MCLLSEGKKRKSAMVIFNVLLEGWFILTNLTTLIALIICNFMHVSHVIPQQRLVFEFFPTRVAKMLFLNPMNNLLVFVQPCDRLAADIADVLFGFVFMAPGHVLVEVPHIGECCFTVFTRVDSGCLVFNRNSVNSFLMSLQPYERMVANIANVLCCTVFMIFCHVLAKVP